MTSHCTSQPLFDPADPRIPVPFKEKYQVTDRGYLTPCWIWQASKMPNGYGQYRSADRLPFTKSAYPHRIAYTILVGDIPDNLQVDHLCRNRDCCNPAHLEPVTCKVNLHRGQHPSIIIHLSSMCKYGHSMTPDNIYTVFVKGKQRERCRECCLRRRKEYVQRRNRRA